MDKKRTVEWSQIMDGEPIQDGRLVHGLGLVQASERTQQRADDAGGNPIVELILATKLGDKHPRWLVGQMYPRDPALTEQWKREKLRFQMLRWYFDSYNTNPSKARTCQEFADETQSDGLQSDLAWHYLLNQKLIRAYPKNGVQHAVIMHEGVQEVERRLSNPGSHSDKLGINMSQTNNFGAGNYNNLQIGGIGNSASGSQHIGVSGDELATLASLLNQEIARLPQEERADAEEVVEGVLEEAKREKPRLKVLNTLVAGLPATIKALPALADFIHKMGG